MSILRDCEMTTLKAYPFPSEDLSNPPRNQGFSRHLMNTRKLPFRELAITAAALQFMYPSN